MKMVYVPAGSFPMGSADNDSMAGPDEKPRHQVTLDAFWVDRIEVTNAQYAHCVAAGDCQKSAYADNPTYNGADYPVVGIFWQDAANYCQWAGGRLPSEAEWEYAARGPEGRIWPWGNIFDISKVNIVGIADGYEHTAPVGRFPGGASWVGALDMAGNVWEWVNGWYSSYPSEPQVNPIGPSSGQYRVLRGGSWGLLAEHVRTTFRCHDINPDPPSTLAGFRCAAAPGK